jgi:hypothetical protein
MDLTLLSNLYHKWYCLDKIIIPEYEQCKVTLNRVNTFFEIGDKMLRLSFFYEDFYVHSIIFLDMLAKLLSDGAYTKFPGLLAHCQKNTQLSYAKQIASFAHHAGLIRHWRNNLFVHANIIIHFGGSIRTNPHTNTIEYLLIKQNANPPEQDIAVLKIIRDKYGINHHELCEEQNCWEILIKLEELSIELTSQEQNDVNNFIKKYGTILPKLEIFIQPLRQLVKDLKIFEPTKNPTAPE